MTCKKTLNNKLVLYKFSLNYLKLYDKLNSLEYSISKQWKYYKSK